MAWWHYLWPPDDENDVDGLEQAWRTIQTELERVAGEVQGVKDQLPRVWMDGNGTTVAELAGQLVANLRTAAGNAKQRAEQCANYERELALAKAEIKRELIELGIEAAAAAATSWLPGAQAVAAARLARRAARIKSIIDRGMAVVRALRGSTNPVTRLAFSAVKNGAQEAAGNVVDQAVVNAQGHGNGTGINLGEVATSGVGGAIGGPLNNGVSSGLARTGLDPNKGLGRGLVNAAVSGAATDPLASHVASGLHSGVTGQGWGTSPTWANWDSRTGTTRCWVGRWAAPATASIPSAGIKEAPAHLRVRLPQGHHHRARRPTAARLTGPALQSAPVLRQAMPDRRRQMRVPRVRRPRMPAPRRLVPVPPRAMPVHPLPVPEIW